MNVPWGWGAHGHVGPVHDPCSDCAKRAPRKGHGLLDFGRTDDLLGSRYLLCGDCAAKPWAFLTVEYPEVVT